MLNKDTLQRDFQNMVGDLPQSITIAGVSRPCSVVSPVRSMVELLSDRYGDEYEFSVTLDASFVEDVEVGNKATYEGTEYRVVSPIGLSVDGIAATLHLCNLTGARI